MKLLGKAIVITALVGAGSLLADTVDLDEGKEAEVIDAKIQADFAKVSSLEAAAEKAADVIKLNCIHDKMVQMKPQMKIADSLKANAVDPAGLATYRAQAATIGKLAEAASACVDTKKLGTELQNNWSTSEPIPEAPPTTPEGYGDGGGLGIDVEPGAYGTPMGM